MPYTEHEIEILKFHHNRNPVDLKSLTENDWKTIQEKVEQYRDLPNISEEKWEIFWHLIPYIVASALETIDSRLAPLASA